MYGKSGALNPFYGKKHTEETKRKWRPRDVKGSKNPMYGKKSAMLGKHHTEEAKKKISDQRIGDKNPFYGKKHSETTKEKMRAAHKRRLNANNKPPIDENGI